MSDGMADALFRAKAKEIDLLRSRMAQLEEALGKLAPLRCSNPDHQTLRHPMCGDCRVVAVVEAALSQPPGEWLAGVKREARAEVWDAIADARNGFSSAMQNYARATAHDLRKGGRG